MKYRREIDGLRTLAVLPVILFHTGVFGFSGGYVGVDIFFVISGYLITSIIIADCAKDNFSIINFYERRARRILPALSAVLIFSTIMAFILMPPNLLKSYSQSVISVVTFSSNVFFYLTNDYFATASDEKPLLHTWSLAVEEQYYLFFPLIISWLWFSGKKKLTFLISILAIMSLSLSQSLSMGNVGNANFYLIFSRAWELFAGSIIALVGIDVIHKACDRKSLLSNIGLLLILFSIYIFDNTTPFPSVYALIPVLGAALIIIYGDETTFVGRVLSSKPFVSIGLISYSLYLWHQPLFAFLRLKTAGEPEAIMFAGAIMLTFVMAYLSYKFVEQPFRNKELLPTKKVLAFSIASIFSFFSVGLLGHFYEGFSSRFEYKFVETIKPSPKRDECHIIENNYIKPENACQYGGENLKWAAFGDSHVVESAYALSQQLEKNNIGLLHLSFSGCAPALLFDVKRSGCSDWIKSSLEYLENNEEIENVLLGFRYSKFLFGDQLDSYPDVPDQDPSDNMLGVVGYTVDEGRELYWESFLEIVTRLRHSNKNIYVIYPIPELPTHISNAVMPFSIFSEKTMLDLSQTTTSGYYMERNGFMVEKLDSLDYGENLHSIKPFDIFCTEMYCPSVDGESSLYFDDNHLSVYGASKLIADSQILE